MSNFRILIPTLAILFPLILTPAASAVADTKAKAEYDALAENAVQSLAYIGKPLKKLTDEQMASVAALLVMTRQATLSEGLNGGPGAGFAKMFWGEVRGICPPTPKFELTRGGCLDEEIAYAQGMARCEAEGRSREDCERENAGPASAALTCHMRAIEEMRGLILEIAGRKWPPRPFPWPEQM